MTEKLIDELNAACKGWEAGASICGGPAPLEARAARAIASLQRRLDETNNELARCTADAKRYRWIKANTSYNDAGLKWGPHFCALPQLDAAIDSAIAAETPLKEHREWVYALPPRAYEISGCPKCGNSDPMWSEFKEHLWCEHCQLDFIPTFSGVFDGPIPVKLAAMLGITFDRIIISTGKIQKFDVETGTYVGDSDGN